MTSDSFIGEGLAPSPYQELLEKYKEACKATIELYALANKYLDERDATQAEVETLRVELDECRKHRRLLMDADNTFKTMMTMQKELDTTRAEFDRLQQEQSLEIERLRVLLREARTEWVDKDYPLADRIDAALSREGK
jgi:uncharacterized coiled-coil DUF342 family protein